MKVEAYVLVGITALLSLSAVPKDVGPGEGFSPGDVAPGIKSLGNESDFNFSNHSGRYTLLNFWAAYDGESRARNIRFSNEISKLGSGKIALRSVSFDENKSIFSGTIRIDRLDGSTQFYAGRSGKSDLYGKYNLKKGFRNYLINDKGIIVAVNVNPDELVKMLN